MSADTPRGIERAALGAILAWRGAQDHHLDRLEPGHFLDPICAGVCRAMRSLRARRHAVDLVSIAREMRSEDTAALRELADGVPDRRRVETYVRDVLAEAGRRALRRIDTARASEQRSVADGLAMVRAELDAIERSATIAEDYAGPEEHATELARYVETERATRFIPTGLVDLDRRLGGLVPGELTVIAARPGHGKTALALRIGYAVSRSRPVAIVSLEMSRMALWQRMLAAFGDVPHSAVRAGRMSPDERTRAIEHCHEVARGHLYIDDRNRSLADITAAARRLHARAPLTAVIVDYAQLIQASAGRHSREQEVAEVARALKELAMSLDASVIALAQLSREIERREDKTPRLSDLRESGALEQDADNVCALNRRAAYDETADPHVVDLHVLKQRNGATGTMQLRWAPAFVRFDSMEAER